MNRIQIGILVFFGVCFCFTQNLTGESRNPDRNQVVNNHEMHYNGRNRLELNFMKNRGIKILFLDDQNVSIETLKTIETYGEITHLELGVRPEGVDMPDGSGLILSKLNNLETMVVRVSNWNAADLGFVSDMKSLRSLTVHSTFENYMTMDKSFALSLSKSKSLSSLFLNLRNIDNEMIKQIALIPNLKSLVVVGPLEEGKTRTAEGLSAFNDQTLEHIEIRISHKK